MTHRKTAILLFTRSLKDEFSAKSFGLKPEAFRRLYRALLTKTRSTINSAGVPIFEISSNEQVGNSFGERLTHAIDQVVQQGFENILIVGNDAPDLDKNLVGEAITHLEAGRQVLGQDHHGGCYLIGLKTANIEREQFQAIHWQTNTVFNQLNALLQNAYQLPALTDLNNRQDLMAISSHSTSLSGFVKLLKALVLGTIKALTFLFYDTEDFSSSTDHLRGPPAFAA